MYDAMTILGFNAVHSGYSLEVRAPLCAYLFRNGGLDEALGVLDGFDAAMDEPFFHFYEEIGAAFPEAKFLLTISDAESWFNNYVEMVGLLAKYENATERFYLESLPWECVGLKTWGCHFENSTAEEKQRCLEGYARHNAPGRPRCPNGLFAVGVGC